MARSILSPLIALLALAIVTDAMAQTPRQARGNCRQQVYRPLVSGVETYALATAVERDNVYDLAYLKDYGAADDSTGRFAWLSFSTTDLSLQVQRTLHAFDAKQGAPGELRLEVLGAHFVALAIPPVERPGPCRVAVIAPDGTVHQQYSEGQNCQIVETVAQEEALSVVFKHRLPGATAAYEYLPVSYQIDGIRVTRRAATVIGPLSDAKVFFDSDDSRALLLVVEGRSAALPAAEVEALRENCRPRPGNRAARTPAQLCRALRSGQVSLVNSVVRAIRAPFAAAEVYQLKRSVVVAGSAPAFFASSTRRDTSIALDGEGVVSIDAQGKLNRRRHARLRKTQAHSRVTFSADVKPLCYKQQQGWRARCVPQLKRSVGRPIPLKPPPRAAWTAWAGLTLWVFENDGQGTLALRHLDCN
ncbi:MAG: hypothetical protein H6707_18400 [Deltaproteobacteria bacterium]|nr:hypothetical protein [Deltaproteobacteria bacterium]